MPRMERMRFEQHYVPFEAGGPISHVLFPLDLVVSLVIRMRDGPAAEVGLVGNEGLAGLPLYFGADESPVEGIVQLSGHAMRMPRSVFVDEIAATGALSRIVGRYSHAFAALTAQSAACNALHPVEQRLCRWILMQHDRLGQDTLPLTQEFLAIMLGVQRTSVNLQARLLQQAGLIRYNRGKIDVTDRSGLEASSCECYGAIRKLFEAPLQGPSQ